MYDERGLVVSRAVASDVTVTTTDYTHDALGRLTESVTEGVVSEYGWDAASNLVFESVSDDVTTNLADDGWEVTRTVNTANQLVEVVRDVRGPETHTTTETFSYDERGNRTGSLTKRTTGGKTHTLAKIEYRFDAMDQVTFVRDHGDNLNNSRDDTVTQWDRDGLGRALTVTENGTTKARVFDGTALVVDGDTRITRAPNGAVLSEAFETVEGKGRNAVTVTVSRDVLADVLGSAVAVAEDGIIDADLVFYTDFGEELFTPERVTVTGFTDRTDAGGLTEFATRAYDPKSRVWIQEDTYTGTVTRASSMNRYAYVEGAPETYVDAWGMYRAASAVAAQQLSAVEYAEFMARFEYLAIKGFFNEQKERYVEAAKFAFAMDWVSAWFRASSPVNPDWMPSSQVGYGTMYCGGMPSYDARLCYIEAAYNQSVSNLQASEGAAVDATHLHLYWHQQRLDGMWERDVAIAKSWEQERERPQQVVPLCQQDHVPGSRNYQECAPSIPDLDWSKCHDPECEALQWYDNFRYMQQFSHHFFDLAEAYPRDWGEGRGMPYTLPGKHGADEVPGAIFGLDGYVNIWEHLTYAQRERILLGQDSGASMGGPVIGGQVQQDANTGSVPLTELVEPGQQYQDIRGNLHAQPYGWRPETGGFNEVTGSFCWVDYSPRDASLMVPAEVNYALRARC